MYPTLFEVGNFSVSTFGLMVALGFLAGSQIAGKLLEEKGEDPEHATTILLYTMIGGVIGSKVYFAIDHAIRTDAEFWSLFFQRAGMTFYGGLIGGALLGYVGCKIHKIPTMIVSHAAAPAMAIGQALGRVGCFLVGDDYGKATELPWGVAFPNGAPPVNFPVHPTQLYECFWLLLVLGILWKRRHKSHFLFGEYLALNGLGRLFVEALRLNPKLALGLTQPQWIGIALIALGVSAWIYFRPAEPATA